MIRKQINPQLQLLSDNELSIFLWRVRLRQWIRRAGFLYWPVKAAIGVTITMFIVLPFEPPPPNAPILTLPLIWITAILIVLALSTISLSKK